MEVDCTGLEGGGKVGEREGEWRGFYLSSNVETTPGLFLLGLLRRSRASSPDRNVYHRWSDIAYCWRTGVTKAVSLI